MSRKYKIYEGGVFFVTLTVVGWIDIFTRNIHAEEIVRNLNYCTDQKGLHVYAFCIMPSHLHMVASAERGSLSDILRDFKNYTAKQIIKAVEEHPKESRRSWLLHLFKYFARYNSHNAHYQFWQQHNHPLDMYSSYRMQRAIDYIHQNPVKAGLVDEACHYLYSSAYPLTEVKLSPI